MGCAGRASRQAQESHATLDRPERASARRFVVAPADDALDWTCNRRGLTLWLALYQPDIAANAAAALRLSACLDLPLLVIEPAGFVWDRRRLARVALDYAEHARVERLPSWSAFEAWRDRVGARLVLLTTRAETSYGDLTYRADDVLMVGRESAGVPDEVHAAAACRVRIPMAPGRRSLNVVTALAMVAGEALRQTGGFPTGRT
jgi:tRNA (cytidine/uridine-2'-O-)-methyltransferase